MIHMIQNTKSDFTERSDLSVFSFNVDTLDLRLTYYASLVSPLLIGIHINSTGRRTVNDYFPGEELYNDK